ncbi:hypothetical protein ACOMHN_045796 [Nucella lapillus]
MENAKMVEDCSVGQERVHLHTSPHLSASSRTCRSVESLPNFRLVCGGSVARSVNRPSVFRSSRPDFLTTLDLSTVKYELGIKCIVDCRSKAEYCMSKTKHDERLLDGEYQLLSVKLPKGRNYRHNEPVLVQQIPMTQMNHAAPASSKHYLINFFTSYYIFKVICRAPWYIKLWSLIVFFYDYFWCTGYKYFVRLFATRVLNKTGLLGQYKDMIDFSQRSICAALKLLTKEDNLPVLVNCAHGKDRTGIICALVLHCQGKAIDYIAADYAQSETNLADCRERLRREMVSHFHLSEDFLSARAETMEQLLCYIKDKYGSVSGYLNHIGFGPREQEMLRNKFVASEDSLESSV